MRLPILLILGLLVVCAVDGSVISDEALTASLQDAWYSDEFIIALSKSNIKEKKRQSGGSIETLLAVKYQGTKTKLVLLVDRRTKRVILESLDESGRRSASHVKVDSLSVNTPMKSLIMLVHQAQPNTRVDMFVDCIYAGSIPLKKTFRDIFETEDNPSVEVFRDRKCRIKVYQTSTITEVLRKEQCPENLTGMKQPSLSDTKTRPIDSDEDDQKKPMDRPDTDSSDGIDEGASSVSDNGVSSFSSAKHPWDHKKPSDKKDNHGLPSDHAGHPGGKDESAEYKPRNPKRPGRSPYSGNTHDGYPYPNQTDMDSSDESGNRKPRRGDIGIQSLEEECQTDTRIVKALNELINATRKLWRELELNRMETQHLRHLIENCSACRTGE